MTRKFGCSTFERSLIFKFEILAILKIDFEILTLTRGGGQNLERTDVERSIFRKFETSNIEITKVELYDFLYSNLFLTFASV